MENRLTFHKISEFRSGTLARLLEDAYSFNERCKKEWNQMWLDFDLFFTNNIEIGDSCCFITCLDSEPIGLVSWNPTHLPKYVEIGHNCIITKYKGNNYGHIELVEAISRIKELNPEKIIVTTNEITYAAQKNYESVGFNLVGRRQNLDTPFSGDYLDYELVLK